METILSGIVIVCGAALINFIATKIYNYFTDKSKNFLWQESSVFNLRKLSTNYDFQELKKRIRIVVIDDEEEGFPVNIFQSEGYAIDKWKTVTDYGKLESGFYDIIVLDIKGVAQHISKDDGLGVLESLKRNNPAQIIIAYSQHSYDLDKAKFWELADEKIAKPSDFLKMKRSIDNLIINKFKPERYLDTLQQILRKNKVPNNEIRKVNSIINKSIKHKETPDWENKLNWSVRNTELINQIKIITNTVFKFFR
jgi:Response regulators consisting of a CheY-like receiver domain and a winged-helix DNA-binding domain